MLHEFFNDPAGDRLITQVTGSAAISAGTDRPDEWQRQGSYQGTHYRFDRAGNLTHQRTSHHLLELTWDANHRLVASKRTGQDGQPQVTAYAYDPLGRRLFKETKGQRTWFGWDGDAMTMDVIAGQPREFVYRPETFEPLALLGASQPGPLLYVNDPNGCPTRLMDGQGQVKWAASYSAWGAIDKQHANAVDNPIRLQGQYEDAETGLYYNRYRYYDPSTGQFTSDDPKGLSAGTNLYQYAPNTWRWIDPLGLTCETYYRTMSREHFDELKRTGKLPPTRETFISPTRGFSEDYDGVLVEFKMKQGTTDALKDIGVRDTSKITASEVGELPTVSKGWTANNAYFKGEGDQINIGLGKGKALDLFNDNIESFSPIRGASP
jgi:RHS repeat-associated protein